MSFEIQEMFLVVLVILTFAVACLWILPEWQLKQLRWRLVTQENCTRYLELNGWKRVKNADLDKGVFRVHIECIASDSVTVDAVMVAVLGGDTSLRHPVIVARGPIAPEVVSEMLTRKVTVISYKELDKLEIILATHQDEIARLQRQYVQTVTAAFELPTPAPLVSRQNDANSCIGTSNELVATTERVQCYFRDAGTNRLIVHFNDSWTHGQTGRLYPSVSLEVIGASIVDFVSVEPNWFPANDMASLIPHLLRRLGSRFPTRVAFGFSQGGYGAIKYSAALGITTTVAISPQYSIDQRLIKSSRFSKYFKSHLNVGMAIQESDCRTNTFVLYDPYDEEDLSHTSQIARHIAVKKVDLPFLGHNRRLFDSIDRLKNLLNAAIDEDTNEMFRLGASVRRSTPNKSYLTAMQVVSRKPNLTLQILDRYGKTWNPVDKTQLLYRLALNGQPQKALSIITEICQTSSGDAEVLGGAALIALECNEPEKAFRFVEQALTFDARNAKWQHVEKRIKSYLT